MKQHFVTAILIAMCGTGVSARAVDAESDAWTAAMALKAKSQRTDGQSSIGVFTQTAEAFQAFATTYPSSPRAQEAQVEAGVCWFAIGRNRQVLHRNPPEGLTAFRTALDIFGKIVTEHGSDPAAGRAQYMRGSTQLFLGDLPSAEREYTLAIEKYRTDEKYFGKSLERRAAVRRHLLRNEGAVADMQRYQKDGPQGSEDSNIIVRQLELSNLIGKKAPPLIPEAWVQGEPLELDNLGGDVVALYFFAGWCPNCAKEREFVNDLYQRYSASGFRVIGVVDHSENQTVASMQAHLALHPVLFPVMMDGGKTLRSFQVGKFPDMALIDRTGHVRWRDNAAALADWTVEALLAEGADGTKGAATPK